MISLGDNKWTEPSRAAAQESDWTIQQMRYTEYSDDNGALLASNSVRVNFEAELRSCLSQCVVPAGYSDHFPEALDS